MKKETKQAIALIALLFVLFCVKPLTISKESKDLTVSHFEPLEQSVKLSSTIEVYSVSKTTTFTAYTLSPQETDQDFCVGAGNHNLCELRPILKEKGISICASRDLPLHTYLYIEGFGVCEVLDRLNVRYLGSNRVDVLFDSREEALNFGIKKLNYIKL